MATRKVETRPAEPVLSEAQASVLRDLYAYLDAAAVSGPGQPDTPALREARALRTRIQESWPALWAPAGPIVTASI